MIEFTVYGKPKGKGRPRFTRYGHAYTPDDTRDYELEVRMAYIAAGGRLAANEGPVEITISAFYPIPKSARKSIQAQMRDNVLLPMVKPDWDNVGKIICDALNGVAWHDDAQVTRATVRKVYSLTPMVRVEIREATSC